MEVREAAIPGEIPSKVPDGTLGQAAYQPRSGIVIVRIRWDLFQARNKYFFSLFCIFLAAALAVVPAGQITIAGLEMYKT